MTEKRIKKIKDILNFDNYQNNEFQNSFSGGRVVFEDVGSVTSGWRWYFYFQYAERNYAKTLCDQYLSVKCDVVYMSLILRRARLVCLSEIVGNYDVGVDMSECGIYISSENDPVQYRHECVF